MSITTRVADKAGVIGTVVGSFGCAACFPAAASIGAAIGLGFLGQWEGLFVRILIPIFAIVALLANLAGWFSHRQWQRALTGSIGPVLALIGAFGLMGVFGMTHGFLPANVARGTFYAGLIVMILVAVWDLVGSGSRSCRIRGIETPARRS
ncbi:MAG: organomercurial transporter MerC [Xanthomonadales bacterium]|nr:organomercurial transporter MerC [Xanthomonadales bacterium]ODU73596.1 MAG: Mercuric resistance protein MerC [Rhodanobacter sp. SCN 69-32]OJY84082.1 MAG: Mercuric resistance protein MerC [Xanthomonadales bacterium 66-474]